MAKAFPSRKRRKVHILPDLSLDRDIGDSKQQQHQEQQQPRTTALLGHVVNALDDLGERLADAAEHTADFVGGHGSIGISDMGDGPERGKSVIEDVRATRGMVLDVAVEPLSAWLSDLLWGAGFLCYVLVPLAIFGYCMFKGLVAASVFQQSQAAAICIWTFSIVMMTISHF